MSGVPLWDLFLSGGAMVWPLFLCSVISMTVILEKILLYISFRASTLELLNQLFEAIKGQDIGRALSLCDKSTLPIAGIMRAGILKYGCERDEIVRSMEEAAKIVVARLQVRLSLLAMVINIAPLLGLLGTLIGLGTSLHVFQLRLFAMNPLSIEVFFSGLWQALISAVLGIIVTIPSLLAYNFFISYQNAYVLRMESDALDVVRFMINIPMPSMGQQASPDVSGT